ncbi:MAG TPA: transketolase C-terminal domain-containing protein, partial [Alphaproteobacteria bacterium]|nr:transketolase C-terminal domain-containing protein [Alphaproteobacteria bacterium]
PFDIPAEIVDAWRTVGDIGQKDRKNWQSRLDQLDGEARKLYDRMMKGDVTAEVKTAITAFKQKMTADKPKIATRAASGKVLEALVPVLPEMIGGSADLTGSNLTLVKDMGAVSHDNFKGSYIYYGVREHAMAAAMNGMALHKGLIPYSGTFLSFTDYCRPAIRLSALMKQRVIYVMTHDSIGLGEDGPTHQPVEHLAALRAIPNTLVLRPADVIETAEAWQIALEHTTGPSILVLTRQNLPLLRTEFVEQNVSAKGAYILSEASAPDAAVTLWATGSEVEIAIEAQKKLEAEKIPARVISVPSLELFAKQDASYRNKLLDGSALHVAVEAAVRQGWDAIIGPDGIFIGMQSFGESAPYQELYEHFGITADHIVAAVKKRV